MSSSKDKHITDIDCPICGEKLLKVEHYEYDGVTEYGSYEPYYECINNCEFELE